MKAPRIHFEQVYKTVRDVATPKKREPVNVDVPRNEDHPVADFPPTLPWSSNPNSTASTGGGGVLGETPEPPSTS